jgi:cysteinyl-tRNA synthetase
VAEVLFLLFCLGLQLMDATPDISDDNKRLLLERQRVREAKDWKKSDELRDKLYTEGIVVRDTPTGVIWSYTD